jgi:hypothetical protein
VVIRNLEHKVFTVKDFNKVKIRNLDDHMVISVEDNHYVVIRNLKHKVFTIEDLDKVKDLNAFIYNNIFYKFCKILIRS